MLILALSLTAEAGYIVSVGDEHEMNPYGTFHRTAPFGEDGWLYMIGTGGNWLVSETDADHVASGQGQLVAPDFDQMVDRGIARCPDRGWLLAASGNVDDYNDTLWVWRFDEDWNLLGHSTPVDRGTGVATNDMALVCSTFFTGVGIIEFGGGGGGNASILIELDSEAQVIGTHTLSGLPGLSGGAIIADEDSETLMVVGAEGFQGGSELAFAWMDKDLNITASKTVGVSGLPSNSRIYWPQGLMKVGDLYLVTHMARDESEGFQADEGQVWVQVFDADLNHLEGRQITQNSPPMGSMRPGFARRGETLSVSWDSTNVPIVVDVTLDLTGAHVPGDSGEPVDWPDDSSSGGDDSGPGGGDGGGGCGGCSAAGGLGGVWLLGALGLWLRRRR
jgi:hypothetical protein